MYKLIVLCGCLIAMAQAYNNYGGSVNGIPVNAGQSSLASISSSNYIRGLGQSGTPLVGGSLIAGKPELLRFGNGLPINGLGGRVGAPIVGYW